MCESGGNWADTDGEFDGGIQFAPGTWSSYDVNNFASSANFASPAEQVVVGRRVLASQGVGAWPVCGPKVGLQPGD